jgi:hypothetical protein
MMMESALSAETSVNIYRSICCYFPQDSNIYKGGADKSLAL